MQFQDKNSLPFSVENDLSENSNIEFIVEDKDSILLQRQFFHKTQRDKEIEALPIPQKPIWLNWIVKAIRYYQKNISSNLGNRCVFDPSCSHYSEVAYREKGFFKGTFLTVNRLCRCRPQNGGIDEL